MDKCNYNQRYVIIDNNDMTYSYGGYKMNKRIIKVITIMMICMLAFTTGCSSNESSSNSSTPSDSVNEFLEAFKNGDTGKMQEYYAGEIDDLDLDGVEDMTGGEGEISQETIDDLKAKLRDFDYEIVDENIDGENATISAKITTYSLGKTFRTVFSEAFKKAAQNLNNDDFDMEREAEKLMDKELKNMKKDYTGEAKFTLKKDDDRWMIQPIEEDDEILNVFTGDMVNSVSEMFNGIDELQYGDEED